MTTAEQNFNAIRRLYCKLNALAGFSQNGYDYLTYEDLAFFHEQCEDFMKEFVQVAKKTSDDFKDAKK